jgi:signal peptidase I
VTGRSWRAIPIYAVAAEGEADAPPPEEPPPTPPPSPPRHARIAAKVGRGVRDPADRGRVVAEVLEHLRDLEARGREKDFGSESGARHLLKRADRGRPFVAFLGGGGDVVRRFLLHEGAWILAAILAFLLIRGFVAEVFVIPSSSMEPTLQIGDRVVVFKPGGKRMPERWQIVTFARDGVTYVKRAVGLGGEAFRVEAGDVYVNGKLEVKPEDVRETLRFPYRAYDLETPDPAAWRREEEAGAQVLAYDGPTLFAGGDLGGGRAARDVPLRDVYADLEVDHPAGGVAFLDLRYVQDDPEALPAEGRHYRLEADAGGVRLRSGAADGGLAVRSSVAAAPPPGTLHLRLAFVDGVLRAEAPGATFRWVVPEGERPPLRGRLEVRVGTARGARAYRLVLDKDLHYSEAGALGVPPAEPFRIPEGAIFCLGDNTYASRDSRYPALRGSAGGPVSLDELVGPVRFRLWPPGRLGGVR